MSIIFKSTKRRPGEQWQTNGRWYRREHGKTVRIPPPGQKLAAVVQPSSGVAAAVASYNNASSLTTEDVAKAVEHVNSLSKSELQDALAKIGMRTRPSDSRDDLAKQLGGFITQRHGTFVRNFLMHRDKPASDQVSDAVQNPRIDLLRSRQDLDQARGGLLTNREYADATRELEDAWDKYVKSPVDAVDDTPLNLVDGPVIPTVDDAPIKLTPSVVDKEIDELFNDDEPVELLSDTEPMNPVEVDEEPIDVSEIIADYEDVVNKQSEVKHEAAKSLAAEPQLEKKATELAREIRSSSLQRELDGKPGAWEGVEDAAQVWLGGFERLVERYGVIAGGTAASAALVGTLAGGVVGGALGVGAVASVASTPWVMWMIPDAVALAGALTLGGAAVGGGLMAAPIIGAARAFESVTGVNLVRKNLEMATREELCLAGLEEAERCNREWIDLMRAKHG